MRLTKRNLLIVGVALAAALAVGGLFVDTKFREWNERAEHALAFAEEESARADSLHSEADALRERADSIAADASARSPVIRERIRLVRDTVQVPDTCVSFVAQRDSIIDEVVEQADAWEDAYIAEREAHDLTRAAYSLLLGVNDSLRVVLEDRPRPRPTFMPSLEVGPFVGFCADGRPCVGVGVGLTFKVRLPWP